MRSACFVSILFCSFLHLAFASLFPPFPTPDYGRWIVPTTGEVWPKPQVQEFSNEFYVLRSENFRFQVVGKTCDIIDAGVKRYTDIIFNSGGPLSGGRVSDDQLNKLPNFKGFLKVAEIDLRAPCENLPHAEMNERYNIKIDASGSVLKASIVSDSVWGILRGLESFSQMIHSASETSSEYRVNRTSIVDYPRFPHRGLLLDTARHFMPLNTVKKMIDLMAQNKLNVLHWHLSDDASFPYESTLFPSLSLYGSFEPKNHVYKPDDVRTVVEYARVRGIRVMPEFDTPGHTQSWGRGVPGLLTQCHDGSGNIVPGKFGPMDPTKEETFNFLQQFFGEIISLFPDKYLHLGGDEVKTDCWANNPNVQAFANTRGWNQNWSRLGQYFIERLMNVTKTKTTKTLQHVVWEDSIGDQATLPTDTIVSVWFPLIHRLQMEKITRLGYRVILLAPWYLDRISYGVDWDKYYTSEPLDFRGTDEQKSKVIGGQAAIWAEYVDAVSLIPRTWPRASTVAERLWSDRSVNNVALAAPRLEEHRCRMLRRGYNVDPINGVNFCEREWDQ